MLTPLHTAARDEGVTLNFQPAVELLKVGQERLLTRWQHLCGRPTAPPGGLHADCSRNTTPTLNGIPSTVKEVTGKNTPIHIIM